MERETEFSVSLKELIIPSEKNIRIAAFNILAICGIAVSMITAFYNLAMGFGLLSFFACMSGVVISMGLMYYTRKTGNYRAAMILTVLFVFIGLFGFLFLTNGGHFSGIPFFFIFGVVFTAFLLDGVVMVVLVVLELVWYALLCIYSYLYPLPVLYTFDDKIFVLDVIVCETIVSISLAITMYFQIRVYRKKEQELNRAILGAREASRAKSDFLAKMSHDIRTPLNTIMATNEMIVANTSSARIREWVNDSNVSGRILMSLIDDMLDLTRIEAGRLELIEQPWDTKYLFGEIAKIWKLQADKAGLEFVYEVDPELPDYLIGDEDAIRKITNNLLSNAVKYTKEGSVSLTVSCKEELEITVRDTGIGIAPQYLSGIFKPFDRGVQDIYRETSGSGLGLAIVKELVDAQNGTIDCQSELDEGTEFTVRLPQKRTSDTVGAEGGAHHPESESVHIKDQFIAPNARILVVDDNPYNRKVIEGFLEPALIQIDDVESGFEALEMIDIKEYDLVLMDLRMPKMDGAETLDRIRSEYPDFTAPVVVLTADIMNGIEQQMLERGFAGFLSKPVSSSRLYETIARFLPDKVVTLKTEHENTLTLARVEHYQDLLLPYGIDLKLALEYNEGNTGEFLTRAALFDEYADTGIKTLAESGTNDNFYLQVHSIKSIARGVGAYLLAQISETVELRRDNDFSWEMTPVLIKEYERVREGLRKFGEEVDIRQ